MRLYAVVDNDVYLNEVILNNAINASIKPTDFSDSSYNTEMSSYVDRFLYYTNREDWIEDNKTEEKEYFFLADDSNFMILSGTKNVPQKKAIISWPFLPIHNNFFLADNEVLISFEVNEKDVLLLDKEKYSEYTYQFDQVKKGEIDSAYTAKILKEYFESVEKNVISHDSLFNCVAFVKEIPCGSIKLAYITKNNSLASLLQTSKNEMLRRIPMLYRDQVANDTVKELLKHKPNNNLKNSKPQLISGKISGEQDNVF